MAIAVAFILTFATVISIFAFSATAAVTKKTYPFVGAMPNPVGVGQETLIHLGISDQTAWPQVGWEGLTVTVTKPDGKTETLGPFITDTTGGTGTVYVPSMAGTYYLQMNFPEQVIQATASGIPKGTVMQASTSEKYPLVVTEEPREFYPGAPLPTEFWTRPINAQYREWYTVSGNWLTTPTNRFAPYNDAPGAPHILWATTLAEGGLVGGDLGFNGYETGDAYEGKFTGSVILNGVLYFNRQISQAIPSSPGVPSLTTATLEQQVVAVDLKTGKELWSKVLGNNERLSFGQQMYWQTMNMYGAFAYLWTTEGTTWRAYDPLTGRWEYTMINVPSGTNVYGPNGEILRYTVNTARGWMTQWNSTSVTYKTYVDHYLASSAQSTRDVAYYYAERWRPQGLTIDASAPFNVTRNWMPKFRPSATRVGIDWNVTIPMGLRGSATKYYPGDRIIGMYINSTGRLDDKPVIMWGLSLKPGQEGQLLFNTTWKPPAGGLTLSSGGAASIEDKVFTIRAKEIRGFFGFSLDTGQYLWGPTEPRGYMDLFMGGPSGENGMIAYGKLYLGTLAGVLQAIDVKTGQLLWTYENKQSHTELMWGGNNWPIEFGFISDGKVYLLHTEHSGNSPLPRGAPFVCLNATTGEEIFRVDGMFRFTTWGGDPMIADSTIVIFNTYDNGIYAVGRGPSAVTVSASPEVSVHGSSVLIKGTVTDVSPGTDNVVLSKRFPNGVPAVADEYMGEWMKYVYLQSPRPAGAVGVPVSIDVIDANGNFRNIGTTTSDSSGFFSFTWAPDIPGKYTVIATFMGSESYYSAFAETAFAVDEAPPPSPTPQPLTLPPTDTYVLYATVAIIVAIAIVGILLLRKK